MSKPSFLTLPGELQNQIFLRHCDGVDRLLLRRTGARLRQTISPTDGPGAPFRRVAQSLRHAGGPLHLARLRPPPAPHQLRRRQDHPPPSARRACGLQARTRVRADGSTRTTTRYTPGTLVMLDGRSLPRVLCPGCRGSGEPGGATLRPDRTAGADLRHAKTHYCSACLGAVLRNRPDARYSLD